MLICNACDARRSLLFLLILPFTVLLSVDLAMSLDGDVTMFYVVLAGGTLLFIYLSWSLLRYDHKSNGFPPSPPTNTIMGHRLPTKKCVLRVFSPRVIDRVFSMPMY